MGSILDFDVLRLQLWISSRERCVGIRLDCKQYLNFTLNLLYILYFSYSSNNTLHHKDITVHSASVAFLQSCDYMVYIPFCAAFACWYLVFGTAQSTATGLPEAHNQNDYEWVTIQEKGSGQQNRHVIEISDHQDAVPLYFYHKRLLHLPIPSAGVVGMNSGNNSWQVQFLVGW